MTACDVKEINYLIRDGSHGSIIIHSFGEEIPQHIWVRLN